jgi:hypothetical protein
MRPWRSFVSSSGSTWVRVGTSSCSQTLNPWIWLVWVCCSSFRRCSCLNLFLSSRHGELVQNVPVRISTSSEHGLIAPLLHGERQPSLHRAGFLVVWPVRVLCRTQVSHRSLPALMSQGFHWWTST